MTSDEPAAASGGTASKPAPLPFDTGVANQARVYDYLLGGKDNYAADRAAAEAALKVAPERPAWCTWQLASRSRDQVARFFEGTDLVAPGIVRVELWHPDGETGDASRSYLWCGVGRKR
jgi:S-adenosyl methyltransferase